MPLIEVQNVHKDYRIARRESGLMAAFKALFIRQTTVIPALSDLNFNIEAGEIVGYIGPNGAGKSTTIKILCGILRPDSGICRVAGRLPWAERQAHVAQIGVVFGQRSQLWWDTPVGDSFDLLREIYRIPPENYRRTKDELVERLQLQQLLLTPTRQLSLGQRMRCEIAASLLHRPKILFLDEPTIGLDAISKLAVREFIKQLNREDGCTVILTSHDMHDIEALAERIMLIGKGRLLYDGALTELRRKYLTQLSIELRYPGIFDPDTLPKMDGLVFIEQLGDRLRFTMDRRSLEINTVLQMLSSRFPLEDLVLQDESIDELILKLYRELGL